MINRIDLHIHTNFSDGELSPKEIIDEAVKNNVSVISITDHDSIDAYSSELYDYAKFRNIKIINGIEISTKYKNIGIHILGYNFDIDNPLLKEKLSLIKNARHKYLYDVNEKLQKIGYLLDVNELDKIDIVTKSHISFNIINNPKNVPLLLKQFSHIPSKGEFIEKIMNAGCPAYVKKETISPKEATDLIKKINGKAILAHPVAYIHEDNLTDQDILKIVTDSNVDGIESNYIYIDRNNKKINEISKWNIFAKEYNLITTVGSDFHKKDFIHPDIGLLDEDIEFSDNFSNTIINNLF